MALTKDQKTAQVKELTTKLKDAQSVMFSHYIGLNVSDVSDFRNQLRESGAEMKVAKKTLIKLAFKEAGYPDVEPDDMEGAVACIFSFDDPLSGAQTAFKFSKDHEKVTLVGGVFDGKLLTKEEAMELAKMPGREQLLATFVSMLRSPLVSFASQCNSPLGGFARALNQMAEKGGFVEDANDAEESKDAKEESTLVTETTSEKEATKENATDEPTSDEAPAESDDNDSGDSSDSSASSASSDSSEAEEEKKPDDAS